MKLNVSVPKTSKTYSVEVDEKNSLYFIGKKIKDEVDLSFISSGLKGVITGGSDKDGFPMFSSLDIETRKKMFLSKKPGFKPSRKGERKKKRIASRIVTSHIQQINIKITSGETNILEEKYKKPKEEKK